MTEEELKEFEIKFVDHSETQVFPADSWEETENTLRLNFKDQKVFINLTRVEWYILGPKEADHYNS